MSTAAASRSARSATTSSRCGWRRSSSTSTRSTRSASTPRSRTPSSPAWLRTRRWTATSSACRARAAMPRPYRAADRVPRAAADMPTGKASRGLLLTGGSGYVGGLIASTLLRCEDADIVAPVRNLDRERFLAPVAAEMRLAGRELTEDMGRRLHLVPLPANERMSELNEAVAEFGVDEVIHCAGCLDYFNAGALESANVELTRALVEQSKQWPVRRFIYISTAFSSGYVFRTIPEALHIAPGKDPTDYTRTKRDAEIIVATSGLPFLILRPAIIIGDR